MFFNLAYIPLSQNKKGALEPLPPAPAKGMLFREPCWRLSAHTLSESKVVPTTLAVTFAMQTDLNGRSKGPGPWRCGGPL
jgi:hypothetical protein